MARDRSGVWIASGFFSGNGITCCSICRTRGGKDLTGSGFLDFKEAEALSATGRKSSA